jgi:hypothetical protein
MSKKPLLHLNKILIALFFSFQVIICISLITAKYVSLVKNGEVSNDFLIYYSAGYIVHYDTPANMYNLELQRQIQESNVSNPGQLQFYPYNHPPLISPFLGWAVSKDLLASNLRWIFILIVFHLVSLGILIRLMQYLKWERKNIWLVALSGLLFYPATMAYIKGQDSSFLLLGVSLWALGLITSNDMEAGLGLALVMIRPQIALVLALPFVFKKRRVWWWFIGWGFFILLLSFLYIGSTGLSDLFKAMILSGQGLGFDVDIMATFMGAILRGYPGIAPSLLHIIGYTGYFSTILFLIVIWVRSTNIGFIQINISILFAILFAPHLHRHDLILLLIPAIGAAYFLSKKKILELKYSTLIPMVVSIFLIIGDLFDAYFIYYVVILSLVLISWKPEILIHFQRVRQVD